MAQFKGTFRLWTPAPDAPSIIKSTSGDFLVAWFLTVDSEGVKLAPKFRPLRFLVRILVMALVALLVILVIMGVTGTFKLAGSLFIMVAYTVPPVVFTISLFLGLISVFVGLRKVWRFSSSRVANVELNGCAVKFTVLASPIELGRSPPPPPPSAPEGLESAVKMRLVNLLAARVLQPDPQRRARAGDAVVSFQIEFKAGSPEEAAALRDMLPTTRVSAIDLETRETAQGGEARREIANFNQPLKAATPRIWATWLLVALNLLTMSEMEVDVRVFGQPSIALFMSAVIVQNGVQFLLIGLAPGRRASSNPASPFSTNRCRHWMPHPIHVSASDSGTLSR